MNLHGLQMGQDAQLRNVALREDNVPYPQWCILFEQSLYRYIVTQNFRSYFSKDSWFFIKNGDPHFQITMNFLDH